MRWLILAGLLMAFVLTGATCLDTVFGVDPTTGEQTPGGGPAGAAGGLLSFLVPWAGAAIGVVGGIYSDIRRRHWIGVLGTVARGVNEARAQKDATGKIDVTALMDALTKTQEAAGVREDVRKIVHKLEGK